MSIKVYYQGEVAFECESEDQAVSLRKALASGPAEIQSRRATRENKDKDSPEKPAGFAAFWSSLDERLQKALEFLAWKTNGATTAEMVQELGLPGPASLPSVVATTGKFAREYRIIEDGSPIESDRKKMSGERITTYTLRPEFISKVKEQSKK